MMDASNEGSGGDVQFDDIVFNGAAAPPCTPPPTPDTSLLSTSFDADPLGALKQPPWSVTAAGRSTASIATSLGHGRVLQVHGGTAEGDFAMSTPFTGVSFMDGSNAGSGGDVLFDNLSVVGTGAPAGSCP